MIKIHASMGKAVKILSMHSIPVMTAGGNLYACCQMSHYHPETGTYTDMSEWVTVSRDSETGRTMVDGIPIYHWLGY